MEIVRDEFSVVLEEPTLYVDNQSRKRSGHMSHAMAEFKKGSFIDFNANSSAVRHAGHSPFGWVEYRISRDSGKSFSDIKTLPYSYQSLLDGVYSISVEKAVATDSGKIIAFCLRNSIYGNSVGCTPWASPTYIISDDEGESWTAPRELTHRKGRIYDALYHKGSIYVLMFENDDFLGKTDENKFVLLKSDDEGESFYEASILPTPGIERAYCAMIFDQNGALHFYGYNAAAEDYLDHAVSRDFGKSWTATEPSYIDKGIRNPQIGFVDGVYILHGRAGGVKGFVLYSSSDAVHFDSGTMLIEKPGAYCFYSNNITLEDEEGKFLLLQYSDTYDSSCRVNVWHQKLRIKK